MNDRYLSRGKREDNDEWVEGYYSRLPHQFSGFLKDHIVVSSYDIESETGICNAYPVVRETVGRCTGLKDKNGKLIFEGDILKGFRYPFLSEGEHNYYAIVVWFENSPAFGISTVKNPHSKVRGISDGNTDYIEEWDSSKWEVIGNIHDNPELLEVHK